MQLPLRNACIGSHSCPSTVQFAKFLTAMVAEVSKGKRGMGMQRVVRNVDLLGGESDVLRGPQS